MKYTLNLKKINKKDIAIAGGKGASLGEMMQADIPVPPGFVISTSAFDKFYGSAIPEDLAKKILAEFKKLKAKYVAVRSSATAEDSSNAAWAGQLESYLNTTEKNLLENVKKCWASLYSPRANAYKSLKGLDKKKISVAVVIQKMVQSEISGVCFTVHPVTKDKNQMIIEAGYGLGEAIVGGKIIPDTYIINKKNIGFRNLYLTAKSVQRKQKLSDKQIIKLTELCQKIEKLFKYPQDIEWAFAKGKFYILQSRPITTL
jgi:pyruvate,water dikinase